MTTPDASQSPAVAAFVTRFRVGSETFVANELRSLHAWARELRVFSRTSRPRDIAAAADLASLGDLVRYPAGRHARLYEEPLTWAGPLALELARGGLPRLARRTFYPRTFLARAMASLGRQGDFDVLYCHFGPNGLYALDLCRLGVLRGRLVVVFHGHDVSAFVRRHGAGVYDDLFAAGHLFLPVSEHWRDELVRLGCPPEKIRVHRMGVDTGAFPAAPLCPDPARPLRLVTVARLVEKKGIEYALRALAVARRQAPLTYTIVGDGPLRAHLEACRDELGLEDVVTFAGNLAHPAVRAHLTAADVYLGPSVTAADGDQEGIPVAIMEAMACGRPVVATRHTGIPELVEQDRSGWLVPERDADALADAVAAAALQRDRLPDMGAEARSRIERDHRLDHRLAALRGLLEGVAGG